MAIPSLTLRDLASFRILDKKIPLYRKLRDLKYDRTVLDALYNVSKIYETRKKYRTQLYYFIMVNNNYLMFEKIPAPDITYNLCLYIARKRCSSFRNILQKVPHFITEELCLIYCSNPEFSISYIIDGIPHVLTRKICFTAVYYNWYAFERIVEKAEQFVTPELCLAAVRTKHDLFRFIIKNIPQFITEEICIEALESDFYVAWNYIIENMKYLITREFCFDLVKKNENALKFIIQHFHADEELYIEAVKNRPFSIRHIPKTLVTEEMYLLAVSKNGNVITEIPEDNRTEEMCKKAVTYNKNNIFYISKRFRCACYAVMA